MVKKSCDKNRFYYVQCGDWEGVSVAATPREASINMITQSSECFNKKSKNSEVLIVMDMKDEMESVDTNNLSAFSVDSLVGEAL
tara:strand:+ start:173 stop:424 length:252 start_codon:yes stop_codon:yes gene_type:complete